MSDTSSTTRARVREGEDEESTHFHCRPAMRPEYIKPADHRFFVLADLCARRLKTRVHDFGRIPAKYRAAEAGAMLAGWCIDLAELFAEPEHRELVQEIGKEMPEAGLAAWNSWLDGHWGEPEALIELCWRLGMGPSTVGMVEQILERGECRC